MSDDITFPFLPAPFRFYSDWNLERFERDRPLYPMRCTLDECHRDYIKIHNTYTSMKLSLNGKSHPLYDLDNFIGQWLLILTNPFFNRSNGPNLKVDEIFFIYNISQKRKNYHDLELEMFKRYKYNDLIQHCIFKV